MTTPRSDPQDGRQRESADRPVLRAAAGVVAAGTIVLVAAVASAAPRLDVDPDTFAIQLWLLPVVWVLGGAAAVTALVLMFLATKARHESGQETNATRRTRWFIVLIVLGLVLGLGLFTDRSETGDGRTSFGEPDLPDSSGSREIRTRPPAPFVAGGALLAVAGAVALALRARAHEDHHPPRPGRPEEDAEEALARGREALATAPDARGGILAAYRAMELAFADAGHRRGDAQTSGEFLAQVLLATGTDAPAVHRLTELFEAARYSDHVMTEDMRDEAFDLLGRIEGSLGASV